MDSHPDGALLHVERARSLGMGLLAFARGEEDFQGLKLRRASVGGALVCQALDDFAEQGDSPFAIKSFVGAGLGGGGELELRVGGLPVERKVRKAPAAFLGLRLVPL